MVKLNQLSHPIFIEISRINVVNDNFADKLIQLFNLFKSTKLLDANFIGYICNICDVQLSYFHIYRYIILKYKNIIVDDTKNKTKIYKFIDSNYDNRIITKIYYSNVIKYFQLFTNKYQICCDIKSRFYECLNYKKITLNNISIIQHTILIKNQFNLQNRRLTGGKILYYPYRLRDEHQEYMGNGGSMFGQKRPKEYYPIVLNNTYINKFIDKYYCCNDYTVDTVDNFNRQISITYIIVS